MVSRRITGESDQELRVLAKIFFNFDEFDKITHKNREQSFE